MTQWPFCISYYSVLYSPTLLSQSTFFARGCWDSRPLLPFDFGDFTAFVGVAAAAFTFDSAAVFSSTIFSSASAADASSALTLSASFLASCCSLVYFSTCVSAGSSSAFFSLFVLRFVVSFWLFVVLLLLVEFLFYVSQMLLYIIQVPHVFSFLNV